MVYGPVRQQDLRVVPLALERSFLIGVSSVRVVAVVGDSPLQQGGDSRGESRSKMGSGSAPKNGLSQDMSPSGPAM